MEKRATLKDVAKLADVSTATVSHVINQSKNVSNEIRERVLSAMKALHYRPNTLAKSLRIQESRLIGLMVSDITNPFFSSVVRGIEDELSESGYNVLLCNTDLSVEKEKKYLDVLVGKRIDGLIVSAAGNTGEYFETLRRTGIPIVFLNRCPEYACSDVVMTDNIGGAYKATEHFIKHGYQTIGIITGPQDINTGRERLSGFKKALRDYNLELKQSWIKEGDFDTQSGYEMMKQLMVKGDAPRAIFISNNSMTLGAYNYIKESGLHVPEDVAIIGFDDPEWALIVDPPLTSVRQPAYKQGVRAACLIKEKVVGKDDDAQQIITLNPELVIRGSCGCV